MCGILAVVSLKDSVKGGDLARASAIIDHRGPDDEGFLTWAPGEQPVVWAGNDTASSTRNHFHYNHLPADQRFKVGFGHRRLSILDLSPQGHQPMLYPDGGLAITFNGEVYNYLEVRAELQQLGHQFYSSSDTEVILHAWSQWGPSCLHRFNGMFSFVILDHKKQQLFAVRDRFGVKPLFYYKNADAIYLASEMKQIRTCPTYKLNISDAYVRRFLATAASGHTEETYDTKIKNLPGGHYLQMDLSKANGEFEIVKWYTLTPKQWTGNFNEAVTQYRDLLTDAVNVRLRSDVTVGSCLSGGLDSSSIVCIAAELLAAKGDHSGQETVTACYDLPQYDEWNFAQEVIKKAHARPHRTFPSFTQLQADINRLLWHNDEPVASTSIFSQWSVFKATQEAGLKVMIDGQGADEHLAGYGGNDMPYYTGLLRKGRFYALLDEARAYKKEHGAWPKSFMLGAAKMSMNMAMKAPATAPWLRQAEPTSIFNKPAPSLRENLVRQLYGAPLPALLRYEDRNSMAWSVESRTPFMDYRLIEFALGLPERYIYKNGVRKTILRKAMHGIIPAAIENRRDKMGFVTPEETWLKGEGKQWFLSQIDNSCKIFSDHIDAAYVKQHVNNIIAGKEAFSFMPWRIASLGIWYENVGLLEPAK